MKAMWAVLSEWKGVINGQERHELVLIDSCPIEMMPTREDAERQFRAKFGINNCRWSDSWKVRAVRVVGETEEVELENLKRWIEASDAGETEWKPTTKQRKSVMGKHDGETDKKDKGNK